MIRLPPEKQFAAIFSNGNGRRKSEQTFPYRVVDQGGTVLGFCPDMVSAQRIQRVVGGNIVQTHAKAPASVALTVSVIVESCSGSDTEHHSTEIQIGPEPKR